MKLRTKQSISGYLFLLPNIMGFLIFVFVPIFWSLLLSFTSWDGFGSPRFIGLANFKRMFVSESFLISLKNTIFYSIFFVSITIILAILAAVLLNQKIKFLRLFRTMIFLPYVSSIIAIAIVWQLLFQPEFGPINSFLMGIGISNPPAWLSSSKWAMPAVIIVSVWRYVGYYMIIFLAGLQGIPTTLYEAADIDGASSIDKFWNITIPMLSPQIFFAIIMAIIQSFKSFDTVYTLTEGGPGRSTNILSYTIFEEAFTNYNFGYASAMSYVLFIIILLITLIQFRGQKKWVNY